MSSETTGRRKKLGRGIEWQKHEDAVLAKVCAAARGLGAPANVRGISPTNAVFVRYVQERFHAELAAAAHNEEIQTRSASAIQTRLKTEHRAIAYAYTSTRSRQSRKHDTSTRSRRSRKHEDDDCSQDDVAHNGSIGQQLEDSEANRHTSLEHDSEGGGGSDSGGGSGGGSNSGAESSSDSDDGNDSARNSGAESSSDSDDGNDSARSSSGFGGIDWY